MRTIIWGLAGAVFMYSSGALADPFESCAAAENYGYNTVANLVSASYNRARCDRALASEYEGFLTAIIPMYLGEMAKLTTDEKGACMLRGSNESWLDTTRNEYGECSGVAGFEAIQRRLLGQIAGSLFQSFYWIAPNFYSSGNVPGYFAYRYEQLALTGNIAECEGEARTALSGVPQVLVAALISTVCQS